MTRHVLAAAVLAAAISAAAGTAQAADCLPPEILAPGRSIVVGSSPFYVLTADFNNDGAPDIAVVVNGARQAAIVLGNGDGTFGPPASYPVGPWAPFKLAVGDFNRDGKTDLVVGNTGSGQYRLKLLLGNGDGTMVPASDVTTGQGPGAIAVADYNADGNPDLATADALSNTVSIEFGNGNGTFQAPVSYPCGVFPYEITHADFNGDGFPDLAVCDATSNDIRVFLNGGDGTFASGVSYATGILPYSIAAADLNGDGITDLAAACGGSGFVSVFLGKGAGGHGNGQFFAATNYPAGPQPRSLTAADFDGDGDLDIAEADYDGTVGILVNQGSGTFGAVTPFVAAGRATGVATGDFNRDGRSDVVAANYTEISTAPCDKITVLLNACGIVLPPGPEAPVLTDVRDVPNDEGGRVFLTWTRSTLDARGTHGISGYRVWRRIPPARAAVLAAAPEATERPETQIRRLALRRPDGSLEVTYWEAIADLPAESLLGYGYTAPTTEDSTRAGNPYTAFFVTALTYDPAVFYQSNIDSGYSADNLAPRRPAAFLGTFMDAVAYLHWAPNAEPDLREYRLYRGRSADFVPDLSNLIGSFPDTGFVDTRGDGDSYYKLSAVDIHGNESPFALVIPPLGTPALLSLASATLDGMCIRLSGFAGCAAGISIAIWRRAAGGDWTRIGEVATDDTGRFSYADAGVLAGTRYGYRPSFRRGQETIYGQEVTVDVPSLTLVLSAVTPNPSRDGGLGVSFVLASDARATLEVLDLAGRRITARSLSGLGAGAHRIDLNLGSDRPLPGGVYLVRLTQENRSVTAKAVVAK